MWVVRFDKQVEIVYYRHLKVSKGNFSLETKKLKYWFRRTNRVYWQNWIDNLWF